MYNFIFIIPAVKTIYIAEPDGSVRIPTSLETLGPYVVFWDSHN